MADPEWNDLCRIIATQSSSPLCRQAQIIFEGDSKMETECHCGSVRITLPHAPQELNRCSCSICRRYGALWAYFAPEKLTISGSTDTYTWGDRMIEFHRCKTCGVLTHWAHTDNGPSRGAREGNGNIGVNMQNMELSQLTGIPERDGHADASDPS